MSFGGTQRECVCAAGRFGPGGPSDHWAKKRVDYVRKAEGLNVRNLDNTVGDISDDIIDEHIQRQYAFNIAWHIVQPNEQRSDLYKKHDGYPALYGDLVYTDKGNVHPFNQEGVYQLVKNGIITGVSATELGYAHMLTRAEACTVLSLCLASREKVERFAEFKESLIK